MQIGRLGIIGSMDSEVNHLKAQLSNIQVETISEMQFCQGSIGDTKVVVVNCGDGKVNAAVCAQTLILRYGVTHIINTGSAGSLEESINVGDIVISTDVVHHDYDLTSLGYARGQVAIFDDVPFKADADFRAALFEVAQKTAPEVRIYEGRIASGDQFVSSMERRNRIAQDFGALCCEMEGSAVAQTCVLSKVPFVIVRAVSDNADGSSRIDYRTFEADAAYRSARIVEQLCLTCESNRSE